MTELGFDRGSSASATAGPSRSASGRRLYSVLETELRVPDGRDDIALVRCAGLPGRARCGRWNCATSMSAGGRSTRASAAGASRSPEGVQRDRVEGERSDDLRARPSAGRFSSGARETMILALVVGLAVVRAIVGSDRSAPSTPSSLRNPAPATARNQLPGDPRRARPGTGAGGPRLRHPRRGADRAGRTCARTCRGCAACASTWRRTGAPAAALRGAATATSTWRSPGADARRLHAPDRAPPLRRRRVSGRVAPARSRGRPHRPGTRRNRYRGV